MNRYPICHQDATDCITAAFCSTSGCPKRTGPPLIDLLMDGVQPSLHFVGFRDPQQYENATLVFGPPDFVHYVWDQRAQREIAVGMDLVVFAKYHDCSPSHFNYDDSNEPNDPAAKERLR